jgi:hypothetical protein
MSNLKESSKVIISTASPYYKREDKIRKYEDIDVMKSMEQTSVKQPYGKTIIENSTHTILTGREYCIIQ